MKPHERTVAMTRLFDAPRERVFEAWTKAEHLERWFGPNGFTVHSERLVIACTAHDEEGVARLDEVINVTFAAQGGKTKLVLNATARGASEIAAKFLSGMEEGWAQTIGRLGAHLGK